MTTHPRFDELAAAAIDFGLTSAEEADVANHLATCRACRALAAAYRTDATALHEIAFADAPARVRSAVLAATARSATRTIQPWKLLAAAALLIGALIGAALAIGAWNSRPTLVETIPVVPPSANPATTPVPNSSVMAVEPFGDFLFFRGVAQEGERNGSAWVAPTAGGPPVRLGPATEASWAADGRSIHLVSQDDRCVPTLTTVSIDGQVRDTVRKGLRVEDAAFAWSPDGRQVVFIRWHNGPPPGSCGSQGGLVAADDAIQDVIAMNADGTGQHVLVSMVWLSRPITWSPDGTRIAYTNTITDSSSLLDPVLVRAADGQRIPLTTTPLDGVSIPRWSPDGTQLAFMTFIERIKHIGVITVDGARLRDLGSGDDHAQEPAWSPDGTSIAVAFDIASPDGTLNPGGIAIHTAGGDGRREVTLPDVQSMSEPPAWSPDGTWLAYIRTATDGTGSAGIGLVALDGAAHRELADTAGAQWVAWQPAP